MNADRIQIQEGPSRVFQNRKGESTQLMEDNRVQSALQAKMVETMQRDAMDEVICCKVSSPFSGMWKMRMSFFKENLWPNGKRRTRQGFRIM